MHIGCIQDVYRMCTAPCKVAFVTIYKASFDTVARKCLATSPYMRS